MDTQYISLWIKESRDRLLTLMSAGLYAVPRQGLHKTAGENKIWIQSKIFCSVVNGTVHNDVY